MAKSDAQWQAEGDASTLAEGKVILSDAARLKRAEVAATRLAAEATKRAEALKSVSKSKPVKTKQKKKSPDGPTTLDKYLK